MQVELGPLRPHDVLIIQIDYIEELFQTLNLKKLACEVLGRFLEFGTAR